MGIQQALYTGVTGLSVNADAMSVVANNIANANSRGFKSDRAEFDDLLSIDLSSGSGSAQLGRGARLSDVRTMHTQGGVAVTDNLTDLAIQGQGFFIVENPLSSAQESGGQFYTRTGSFHFDKDGFLSDPTGGHLKGFLADNDNNLSTRLQDLRIITSAIPPRGTDKVVLNANLDSRDNIITQEFDLNNPEKTSNWNTTVQIFDSHGRTHDMTVYFRRTDDAGTLSWDWHALVDRGDLAERPETRFGQVGKGKVSFDTFGLLAKEETFEFDASFSSGAKANQKIDLDFGQNVTTEEGLGVGASSATAVKATTNFHSQNGYSSGNLKSLKVELDGRINGFYTNGTQRTLGALALATFENVDGLQKAGRNQFFKTLDSGPPRIGLPNSGTRGSVFSSSLEESNVDLAGQFVTMIQTQRGFQANSRSVTTTDSMMEEVVNLKR